MCLASIPQKGPSARQDRLLPSVITLLSAFESSLERLFNVETFPKQ